MALKGNCPVCSSEFIDGKPVVYCMKCSTPHHPECFASIGKCSVYACGSVTCTTAAPAEMSTTLPAVAGETLPAASVITMQDKLRELFCFDVVSSKDIRTYKKIISFCERNKLPAGSFDTILAKVDKIVGYKRKILGNSGTVSFISGPIFLVGSWLGALLVHPVFVFSVILGIILVVNGTNQHAVYNEKAGCFLTTIKTNPAFLSSPEEAGLVTYINREIDYLVQALEKLRSDKDG